MRHSVVVASPKRTVINHTQLFTIRFGTSVPKSKSGSYISLFVLELPFPNRKEKADLPQFVLEQIDKPRTFRFGTCPPIIEERTLKQKLDSQFDTELDLEVEKTNITTP